MSTDRSDTVYGYWREASEKFDYFVTGLALALVGYLGADMNSVRIGVTPEGMQAIAAVLLLLSAGAGLKRLEVSVAIYKIMHMRLYSEESAGAIGAAAAGGGTLYNASTGAYVSPEHAAYQYHYHRAGVQVTKEQLDGLVASATRWYSVRNGFLMAGLVVLVSSRVLPAYI